MKWRRLAILLLLAACAEQSHVNANAAITVSGDASAADGSPLAERPVRLGAGISDAEGGLAALTLGLSCTSGKCSGKTFDTTTDAAGHYSLTLKGKDTQSTFGEAVSELLAVTAAPTGDQVSGALTSARFKIQTEKLTLPALDIVDPKLALSGASAVTAQWTGAKPGPYDLTFEGDRTTPVWRVHTTALSAALDPRILEDTKGRAVVSATRTDRVEGSRFDVTWRSPGVGYASGTGPPPSRGRPCPYRQTNAGGATTETRGTCALTDGDLFTAATTAPVIDLEREVPAELIVVRGCQGGCAVDVSADGTTFRPAGAVSDEFGALALDGRPITAVRVGLGTGNTLREVSVWGPRPSTSALKPIDEATRRTLSKPYGGDDKGSRTWVLVLLAVLAAAALVGVGVMIGLRSRS